MTIDDILAAQGLIRPLVLSEPCSRCWMQEHCRRDGCPCDCPDDDDGP